MIRFRLFLPMLLCAMAAAQSAPVYRITGVVISSTDETPVSHAHLSASLSASGFSGRYRFQPRPVSTNDVDADDHGRFTLTLPSAGAWRLTASAAGYVTQAFEAHGLYSSSIVLTPSAPSYDLRFHLPPEAVITGTILDEAGEPIRDARVILQQRALPSPNREPRPFQTRMTTQTDDRGVYEFPNLSPADYRLVVQARPWYSQNSPARTSSGSTPPEPSLDVTYQMTWYPGVDTPEQAEILTLHPADYRTADLHLNPIPAAHLQVILPQPEAPSSGPGGRFISAYPSLERIDTEGAGSVVLPASRSLSSGVSEIDGLAPGLYRLRVQGQNRNSPATIVQVSPSASTQVLDPSAVSAQTANISISLDTSEEDRSIGVELRDTASGRQFSSFDTNMFLAANGRRGPQTQEPHQITLQVPPGRYQISLMARGGSTYLTGITGKGAAIEGRFLTVPAGEVSLTLHTASGHASVTGTATMNGNPIVGAAVLLVPAGLGDPNSFATLVRDQTNTDGSFDLNNIVPGPYILIAIDRGWNVNWDDPKTLEHYLTQGVPLDLRAGQSLRQEITAQAP